MKVFYNRKVCDTHGILCLDKRRDDQLIASVAMDHQERDSEIEMAIILTDYRL